MVLYLRRDNPDYRRAAAGQQFHDLGKLTLGFGIIWAYFFFSQFLPQWYGNMPEETQWLILRTREEPWKTLSWVTFGMAWVTPFILLLSKDLKKTPPAYACACVIALLGVWLERYVVVMPQVSPNAIPLGFFELGLFLGFAAAYVLSVKLFLTKYPLIPVAHPALYSPCGARS